MLGIVLHAPIRGLRKVNRYAGLLGCALQAEKREQGPYRTNSAAFRVAVRTRFACLKRSEKRVGCAVDAVRFLGGRGGGWRAAVKDADFSCSGAVCG